MGNEIVERCVKAIANLHVQDAEYGGLPLCCVADRDERAAIVRAVIAALREPSDAMIEAGVKCHDSNMGPLTIGALNARRNVRQILVAALDASLSTEGNEG